MAADERPCVYCKTTLEKCLDRGVMTRPPWCCPRCWREYDKDKSHPSAE